MTNCVFCAIVAGVTPAHIVWKSPTHIAFLSIFPNTSGFTVVIPKKHLPSYVVELSEEECFALHQAARKVAQVLDAAFDDVARTGIMYEGYGINHAHAKLFPMHGTAGNEEQSWRPIHSDIDTFFDSYRGYLSSHDAARADDAELARLAEHIRASHPWR